MSLPDFKDEAEFREKWIAPFLHKIGYTLVRHTHGKDEQGKDFIFADFDRFEHIRYYAIQAKKGNIGAGEPELDKLLNQVRRMFTVRLRNEKGADEQRVSAVYIFASGKISDTAREYISDHCRSEHYGENVYFLDGDRLERMERFATYRDDEKRRMLLTALAAEAIYNIVTIEEIKPLMAVSGQSAFLQRCRTTAMDQALTSLVFGNDIFGDSLYGDILVTWITTTQLNQTLSLFPFITYPNVHITYGQNAQPLNTLTTALENNNKLVDRAKSSLEELHNKYSLAIEIIDEIE